MNQRLRSRRHRSALVAGLLLLGACRAASKDEPAQALGPAKAQPNIVILYTDDQGFGDCSALNPGAKFETPNMDRLAREGMTFTDGHSAASVCTPSRYALLTGRYAWRTPQGGRVLGADADCMIEDGRTTVASLLQTQGYATGLIGKWHLGMQIPGSRGERDWSQPVTDGPLQKGFETFYGLPASMNYGVLTWFDGPYATEPASLWTRKHFPPSEIQSAPLQYRMAPPFQAERQTKQDVEVAPSFEDAQALRIITEHAVDYIEAKSADPFFLYVAFTSPHLPHCTAPEFQGSSGMGNYGDFVLETDHRVGQILDALEREGLADNTLVLFTSDNGPENNYKDWARLYDHASNGPFRGGKRDLYEGGHRVPFIVRWPERVAPGQSWDQPVGQVDVLATLAELLGAPLAPGQGEDSTSFLHALGNTSAPGPRRQPLVHHGHGRYALREGRWKLHFAKHPSDPRQPGAPSELYDLEADPAEQHNLLSLQEELALELHHLAAQTMADSAASGGSPAGAELRRFTER